MYHVLPINDIKPHEEEGTQCSCKPRLEIHNGEMIVIHNSFDHREAVEMAEEILNEC